jgi:hypothetical protein
MRTILTLLCLFCIKFALADEPRMTTSFKSTNGKFSLQYAKKRWRLKDASGRVLYSIRDYGYTSMTIFVSNDGQRLTVIDDFMEGQIIEQRAALLFYNNGKLIHSYKLTDLVKDTCNVAFSVWHTMWSIDDYGLKDHDSTFSVATFEFNEMEFDTFTGKMISDQKPIPFDKEASIVIGQFTKGDSAQCVMIISKYISGKRIPGDYIKFTTHSFGKGVWRQELMIKDGIDVTPVRFRGRMIPNGCT